MSQPLDETPRRRRYASDSRAAAARQTRTRIREAACRRFLANGYALTSMRSIAEAAGVAEKTVYLQFASKASLLKEVVETAIVGDDEAVAAADRPWFRDLTVQTDLDAKLAGLAEATAALHERSGALFAVARGAAAADPEVAGLWAFGKRGHRSDMTALAHSFEDLDQLPDGVDVDALVTSLYVLLGPESWHLARVELGLGPEGYRDWLHRALRRVFVRP